MDRYGFVVVQALAQYIMNVRSPHLCLLFGFLFYTSTQAESPTIPNHSFEEGLDTGLRAYSHRALSGKRRSTFSIEMRPTFTRTPWYVLAGAVFLDMGSAWNPPSNPFNLYYSAGIGLRAGLPKLYGTPVWRLDLAHAIRQHSWRLSIGFGQYF